MEISLAAEPIAHLGPLPITNSLLASVLTLVVVALVALRLRRVRLVPRGFQNAFEVVVEQLLNLMDSVTNDRRLTKRAFPWVATIFLSVLVSNWLGLLPGFGTIGRYVEHEGHVTLVPFLRSVNADLNSTLALAIISVVATNVLGIAVLGFARAAKRFFVNPLKNPIMTGVGLLELFGEVAKLVSFSFRLFGNVFAGEVLLLVIANLIPFVAPLPFYLLELFVGLIQAFIFAVLTLVFMRVATVEAAH